MNNLLANYAAPATVTVIRQLPIQLMAPAIPQIVLDTGAPGKQACPGGNTLYSYNPLIGNALQLTHNQYRFN